jgi:glycosyltransferase involved in cell wall biosynthesis
MENVGYKDVKVLPLIIPMERRRIPPDRSIVKKFRDGLTNILFVGRCAPNKRIEDLLTCFYYFQKYVEPDSRLIYVGSFAGTERYYYLLIAQARAMELQQRVNFMGCVPDAELNSYYSCADVFLSMSEHEGFCAPLLEAMSYNIPVMAYAAGAVPETMDGSGILFEEKQFELIAEMIGEVVHNLPLRRSILNRQTERLLKYQKQEPETLLKSYLAPLLG